MHVKVPPGTRAQVNEVSRSLRLTAGRYLEILVARDQMLFDERGTPAWADGDVDLTKTIPAPDQAPLTEHEGSAA